MLYDPYEPLPAMSSKLKYKSKNRAYRSVYRDPSRPADGDFQCRHCGSYVVQSPHLSGVQNRNHCPYCLWSRHVDLHESGDRLAACKAPMRPVGLALKQQRKKYGSERSGELMLIHACEACGKLSLNRIAADDLADRLYEVFQESDAAGAAIEHPEIQPLRAADSQVVRSRLFGVEQPFME